MESSQKTNSVRDVHQCSYEGCLVKAILGSHEISKITKIRVNNILEFKSDIAECKPFSHKFCAD